jgi:hypothetical protein
MNEIKGPGLGSPSASIDSLDDEMLSRSVLFGFAAIVLLAVFSARHSIEAWAADLELQYHRRQLLAAYRRRHVWKKSDIPHLLSLGVNSAAQRRMERLGGRGRPVVKAPRPLDAEVIDKLTAFQSLTDPNARPHERRQAFKQWPWWSHYVEALYRGEHARAKERGAKGASIEAEIAVGRALGISAATVHSICGDIRRKRKEDPESANFRAMTLTEYESWMESDTSLLEARVTD